MVHIGDIVRDGGDLRFKRRPAGKIELPALVEGRNRARQRMRQRTIMLDQPFERFPGQIKSVEIGVAVFQRGDKLERMRIVIETAKRSSGCR